MFELITGNYKIMLINKESNEYYDVIDFDGQYNNYTVFSADALLGGYLNIINRYDEILKYTYGQTTLLDILGLTSLIFKKLMSSANINVAALEVGSWFGCSSYFYASSLKFFSNNNRLFCMDTLEGTPDTETHNIANFENGFEHFRSVMKYSGVYDVINPIVCDSKIGMEVLQNDYFDIIFVDASHTYDNAHRDIKNAIKKIKVGGLLIGHDCECYLKDLPQYLIDGDNRNFEGVDGYHCGVIKALDDIFGENYERFNASLVWYKYITEEDKKNVAEQISDSVLTRKSEDILKLSETLTEALSYVCSNIINIDSKVNQKLIHDSISVISYIENLIIEVFSKIKDKELKLLTNEIKDLIIELNICIEDRNLSNAENLVNTALIDKYNLWKGKVNEEFGVYSK